MKDQNPSSFLAGAFSGKHGERGMPQQEKQTQTLQSPAAGPTRIFLRLLALPLAAMATFACSLDGLDEAEMAQPLTAAADTEQAADGANLRLANLVFEEDFEGTKPFSAAHGLEVGASHSLTYVDKPGEPGNRAARFELRDSDPVMKGSKRAEVTIVKGEDGDIQKDTWYAFELYVPADYADEDKKELINQWHQDGTASAGINIRDGRFLWRFHIDGKSQDHDLGAVQKGRWNSFVIHMVHSYGSDGVTELWLNDKKLLDLKGRNMNGGALPKWKIGIYKSNWMDGKTTVSKRVLYFDNVRVGNSQNSYAQMAPGASSPSESVTQPNNGKETNEPTPDAVVPEAGRGDVQGSGIESLVFVNAQEDADISTLVDGTSLNMSDLKTHKISVRANTGSGVGSVKFELSGAVNYSYTDNVAPYALFGDDSKGNYYYGPGMKAGKYTLTVTAYSEAKGKGNVVERSTVSFTVTK